MAEGTASDTARFVLDAFSEKQDRMHTLAAAARDRLAALKEGNGDLVEPIALGLCEILEDMAADIEVFKLAEEVLGLGGARAPMSAG